MDAIGLLETLWRYPVKSMKGEELAEGPITYTGLAGDRVWAFVAPEKKASFPWHSAREQHEMLLYTPRFVTLPTAELPYPDASRFAVEVTTPDGKTFRIDDPAFLALLKERARAAFTLRFSEKGMQDARPLSLFSHATVAKLSEETGIAIDHRRFRPNFFVKWKDETPFFEDTLVGRTLKIGDKVELLVVKKDPRCKIVSLDPDTAVLDPKVLMTVAKEHGGCAGVYLAVVKEGVVKRGDTITLLA